MHQSGRPPTVVWSMAHGPTGRAGCRHHRAAACGIAVTAAPIPLTSLQDDVAAVVREIERTEGPVVLAAHPYAGAVISAAHHPRIQSLVFIAALAPGKARRSQSVLPRPRAPASPRTIPNR